MSTPTIRVLSLGAGVQSTAVAILAARGDLPHLDAAIFADTGWEPRAVYEHLDRLDREILQPAGIPLHRVSVGNIRDDALNPGHRFASMPLYVRGPCPTCNGSGRLDGHTLTVPADPDEWKPWWVKLAARLGLGPGASRSYTGPCPRCDGTGMVDGMGRRQCTSEYKLNPSLRIVRELLGAPLREDGVPGRVPKGRWAEQWIGISIDESDRALTSRTGVSYARPRYPLLEPTIAEGRSRGECRRINAAAGFPDVPKSACIGCPFHGNAQWRAMRDNAPDEWADAVAFDHAIRNGSARANAQGQTLRGQMYLHRSRVPLDHAPIDRVTWREWASRQGDLLDELGDLEPRACSPFGCRIEEAREVVPMEAS